MKEYWKRNMIPVIIEIVFIMSCFRIPKEYLIYTNFAFYFFLLVYFVIKKEFSIKEWIENMKSGNIFWKQVIITTILFFMAFLFTNVLENIFFNFDTGYIRLKGDSWFKLLIFAMSTMILPPITEELFYRKNMLSFKNKGALIASASLGMFLYALEHSISPWGIFLTMLWAVPFTVSYVKTQNIYVPMTAHLVGNILGNGFDVIMIMLWLL